VCSSDLFIDIASLTGAVLLAACMPHVLASRGNIAVDALGSRLGEGAHRWLDRFAALVTAGFFGLMAWQYLRFAAEMKDTGQSIPVLRWVAWPWWAGVALFIVVAAVVGLLTALHREDPGAAPPPSAGDGPSSGEAPARAGDTR
jgi:TRAP-type C4-dicarboxylate transport system permease small subunit